MIPSSSSYRYIWNQGVELSYLIYWRTPGSQRFQIYRERTEDQGLEKPLRLAMIWIEIWCIAVMHGVSHATRCVLQRKNERTGEKPAIAFYTSRSVSGWWLGAPPSNIAVRVHCLGAAKMLLTGSKNSNKSRMGTGFSVICYSADFGGFSQGISGKTQAKEWRWNCTCFQVCTMFFQVLVMHNASSFMIIY